MNRFFSIVLLLALVGPLAAQVNGFDWQVISDEDITGSSRYVGLGGAMAALGGDVSAAKDNPAALGLFRHAEATVSYDARFCHSADGRTLSTSIPAINALFHIGKGRSNGILAHNLMFAYQRLRSFKGSYSGSAYDLSSSQTDLMAELSKDLTYADFRSNLSSGIATLSFAGYDGYLIDTVPNTAGKQWGSVEGGNVNASLSIKEYGYVDDYSFGWGMNVNHKLYVGAGLNIRMLSYTKSSSYSEAFENADRYYLSGSFSATGLGIGVSAGIIGRPFPWLRLAAAVQSPVKVMLTSQIGDAELQACVADESHTCTYYAPDKLESTLRMPVRAVGGVAFQFAQKGLLSLEYDYSHGFESGMRDQHTLKTGAEWAITNKLFLDLGYAAKLYGKYQDQNKLVLEWDAVRVDSDQREYGPKQYVSAGCSYRSNWLIAGFAYQYSRQSTSFWAHELQGDPMFTSTTSQHRLVLTLGLRYGL